MFHPVVSLLFVCAVSAEFTSDFATFIRARLGDDGLKKFERMDMGGGEGGSFGGRSEPNETLEHRPVVFVHGATCRANCYSDHRNYYHNIGGYALSELYATTYDDGGATSLYYIKLSCANVKQVREFIQTVVAYTNSPVDVVAHSLGVAIARKAMLGGRCVDTNEDLGSPLTPNIATFVGIAGVARGFANCKGNQNYPFCNSINGADCESAFIHDVNNLDHRYEGTNSFTIYSTTDYLLGQECCGYQCSIVKNSTAIAKYTGYDHGTIVMNTKDLQLQLIKTGECKDPACQNTDKSTSFA